ncbi:hypothetical protein F4778DRAFT_47142 [Xylariomycetidae sp. FL2044]|nr:hypothetical protein F4778DRAFT_693772 [Xylariomycetidae sp. FL2044]KAH9904812.1 hypothetical protein F4778DRAFT_47142 [Xylariomycetidae sp. FL2044]
MSFLFLAFKDTPIPNLSPDPKLTTTMVDADWIGWVSSPDSRGTLDIVWSSLLALNLFYTMLHLNIPSPSDRLRTIFWRKLRWAFLGLLAPELPMLFACGQWASAVRSVQAMHGLGYTGWSLEHGFFADMGGFLLQPLDAPAIPISAKQLHYLVQHNFILLPTISRAEIRDKSKADGLSKRTDGLARDTSHRAMRGAQPQVKDYLPPT